MAGHVSRSRGLQPLAGGSRWPGRGRETSGNLASRDLTRAASERAPRSADFAGAPGDAAASGAPRTAVPYHRGEILHGLGFCLCHLPGSQLGGAVSDGHLHFRRSAQTPSSCFSRRQRPTAGRRGAVGAVVRASVPRRGPAHHFSTSSTKPRPAPPLPRLPPGPDPGGKR